MEKIKEHAKGSIFAVNVAIICLAVALVSMWIVNLGNINPSVNVQESISRTFHSGFLTFEIAKDFVVNEENYALYILLNTLLSSLTFGLMIYVCIVVRRILIQMKEGKPFVQGTGKKMRTISWVVLVCGFSIELAHYIWTKADFEHFMLGTILKSDVVKSVSFIGSFNWGNILVIFFIIRTLAFVFSYAEELQNLSDETL